MNIQAEKLDLIHWLTELTDESIIAKLRAFREANDSQNLSSEQIESLNRAQEQARKGEVLTHVEAREKLKAKFSI